MRRIGNSCGIVLVGALLAAPPALAGGDAGSEFFETTIRPLLVEKCQSCHGADSPKGDLDLTTREAMLAGGFSGPAVVPGKPEESLLIDVVHYEFEPRMPPKGKLADAEIAALTRWIQLGTPWGEAPPVASAAQDRPAVEPGSHWAFQPVGDPAPPDVRGEDWVKTPIDRFVLAKLESEALTPSPPVDRRTFIRRLSVDLTGLPPSPGEVEAFVSDSSEDAYEQLVDRLLASPHYGEQWARHWLDVARYSDTKGYVYAREEPSWVHAWVYRDWVVRSLNDDLPYDQFLLLQLAADQVSSQPEDLAAMGFLTLGRRFLGVTHDIIDDRIDVVTRGALGLTVACARCHDHKFDPIPTSDYYALYGVFKNSAERLVPATNVPNRSDPPSDFESGLLERQTKLGERMAAERAAAAERVRARVTEYLLAQFELNKYPEEGFDQILAETDLIPAFVRRWRDALVRSKIEGDPIFRAWHDLAQLPADDFASHAEEACRALQDLPEEQLNPLVARAFAQPPASPREVAERYGSLMGNVIEQWKARLDEASRNGHPAPAGLTDPASEAVRRVLYGERSPCEVPDESIINVEAYFPTATTEALWQLHSEVDRWLIRSEEAPPHALILVDRQATTNARVFRRGNPATPGEEVPRRFLQALSRDDATPFQNGSGRLELAHAIIDADNPLTARVAVNRVWMHHFGAGLVRTPGDFGTRAEPPTHPELLDWLATRFMAEGWSLKWLHRQIVLSATYRQSASGPADPSVRERAAQLDPENQLLWRMPVHRLSFEEFRDALLTVTGERDPRIGGKATDLFQTPGPRRRTIYGLVQREDLPSVLRTFDFANPDLLIPQRSESTVPQQALFLLNHPFLLDRARALASRAGGDAWDDPSAKVRRLYQLAYQREPTESQLAAALQLVVAARHDPVEEPPPTVADWRYGFGRLDSDSGTVVDFQPLPHFTGTAWQGGASWPDGSLGWVQLTAEGGHPGNDRDHAAVRRWVAPRDLSIRIQSTLTHEVAQGDGIRGFISGSRQGLIQSADVHNTNTRLDVESLDVKAGDTIDFVVDIRDSLNSDQFLWTLVITELGSEEPATWNARTDFGTERTPPLDPWEQLAHVLLMANEFSFID